MRELGLDALLKEKREEPTSVSITAVDSWLKAGIVFVGLFATLKWLFTKKMWLMLTSISSISIVTILAIVQFNSKPSTDLKSTNKTPIETKSKSREVKPEEVDVTENKVNPTVGKGFMTEMYRMTLLSPNQLFTEQEKYSIEPVDYKFPNVVKDNESKDHFSRIDANGFVHFTLVNGKSCSIQNTIVYEEGETPLDYSIKNGTLYLNSANENKATDLIITVTDLEKIKLNGFCEMVTNSTFESTDLELEVNGFTNLNLDSACEEAHYLSKLCTKVTMLVRKDEFRASKIMADRVKNTPNIEILFSTDTVEVLGDGNGVTGALVKNSVTGEEKTIPCTGFFVAIGHKPNTDIFKGFIDLDETGYIEYAQPGTSLTNVPGVFVAGDAADKRYRQAITAAGTGCMAALDAERYLAAQGH